MGDGYTANPGRSPGRSEVAQIGIEQRGADGLSGASAQRSGLHPGGTAPAELGLEHHCQRGPGGQGA